VNKQDRHDRGGDWRRRVSAPDSFIVSPCAVSLSLVPSPLGLLGRSEGCPCATHENGRTLSAAGLLPTHARCLSSAAVHCPNSLTWTLATSHTAALCCCLSFRPAHSSASYTSLRDGRPRSVHSSTLSQPATAPRLTVAPGLDSLPVARVRWMRSTLI
jgi:hypothetical protein